MIDRLRIQQEIFKADPQARRDWYCYGYQEGYLGYEFGSTMYLDHGVPFSFQQGWLDGREDGMRVISYVCSQHDNISQSTKN